MSKPSDYRRTGCVFVIACLVIAVALFGVIKSSQKSETENAAAGNVATDLAGNGANLTDDNIDDPAPLTGDNAPMQQVIDHCHRFDSCSYAKLERREQVDQRGDETLLRATLFKSALVEADPEGTVDPATLHWISSTSIYAICSTTRPTLIFELEGKWIGEQFDFTALQGLQQNNANTYQAICHDAFANEIGQNPGSYGYRAFSSDTNQFDVASPDDLFAQE